MHPLFDHFTPRTTPRTHLFTAACFWSTVGVFLTVKGIFLLRQAPGFIIFLSILSGTLLGLVKSWLIFDKVAGKIVRRIRAKTKPSCLGGLFSPKNWALIACMMIVGRVLGWIPVPLEMKTVLYVMVGSGLATSSRLMWTAWKHPVFPDLKSL